MLARGGYEASVEERVTSIELFPAYLVPMFCFRHFQFSILQFPIFYLIFSVSAVVFCAILDGIRCGRLLNMSMSISGYPSYVYLLQCILEPKYK